MRPPPIPTRSVSEGPKPVPRLRFGLVLNVSFHAASSIDRRVLPEAVVLLLHPKRNIEAAGAVNLRNRQGWTDWRLSWRIAKLWEIPAEELLAASDVGLIPWVPLTQFLSGQAVGASAEARLGHGSKSLPSQVTIAGAGVEVAIASEPQRGGLGSGRVALRASTPATLSCNPLLNQA